MNKSYSINDLISMYYEDLFSDVDDSEPPRFSFRHKRKMKKAFAEFQRNSSKSASAPIYDMTPRKHISFKSIRKHSFEFLMIAFIAVNCAFLTGAVRVYDSPSFYGTIFHDYTRLYTDAADMETSPVYIEEAYCLSVIPEGYELAETYGFTDESLSAMCVYINQNNNHLVLYQYVKAISYITDVSTGKGKMYPTQVNGHDAVYVQFDWDPVETYICWNSDEYILALGGVFNKDEMIELATLNEIEGFIKADIQ